MAALALKYDAPVTDPWSLAARRERNPRAFESFYGTIGKHEVIVTVRKDDAEILLVGVEIERRGRVREVPLSRFDDDTLYDLARQAEDYYVGRYADDGEEF